MSSPANTTSNTQTGALAIVSLGSNLASRKGDPAATLRSALVELEALSVVPLTISSLYQSAPLESPAGAPDFINAVAIVRAPAGTTAAGFLLQLQHIEAGYGRQRDGVLNQPRTLDLDLISFGEEQCESADLVLPHPRTHLRRFVMAPLAEVAADYILPGQDLTAQQCLAALGAGQPVTKLPS